MKPLAARASARVPVCRTCPAHMTLRAAQARWPSAIIDRDCAQRPADVRLGRRNGSCQPN
jgi:hypothetical protein